MGREARERKSYRRSWASEGQLAQKRFWKALDQIDKRHKSEEAHVIWMGTDWCYSGRRGLIHNGRKP